MSENPFEMPDVPGLGIDLEQVGEAAAQAVYDAVQNASNSTARSKQQQDMFIGISTLGHCRQYAALMMKQTPFSDVRDKTAAFFGTIAGDAIEAQLKIDHPDWLIQEKLEFPIPSGGMIPGTSDIIIPFDAQDTANGIYQGVWDLKSKAELDTIRKYGPSRQQIFQVHAYTRAAIVKGLLNTDEPIIIGDVFFDRSGRDIVPYGVFHLYSEDVVHFIDEWINDVTYAVLNGVDAEKDMPRDWCHNWCEYATTCRGLDTDVEGLIEDETVVQAVETYAEAAETIKAAKKLQDKLKPALIGRAGSTGKYNLRWVEIGETKIESFTRAGHSKIDIRPVPGPKKPAAKKTKAVKAAAE